MERDRKNVLSTGLGVALAGLMLLYSAGARALNPELDVSQYAHTAWKVRDGFTQGAILAIAQTPDGYLWLGTEFGLYRFDGVRSVPWQPPHGQDLPTPHIYSLLVARDGALWIGTGEGAASWKDGKLTRYPELDGQNINSLLEDREGTIWSSGEKVFSTPNICRIRKTNVDCYGREGSLARGGWIVKMYEDSKATIWAVARYGIWKWRPGPPEFYPLASGIDVNRGIAEDETGSLLIGVEGGIRRFRNGKLEPYPLLKGVRPFAARTMLYDQDGDLWIGAYHAALLHIHNGRVDVFRQADGLSSDEPTTIFQDREGSLWVSTNDGLDRFRNTAVATFSLKEGLSNGAVRSVLADRDGSVWLATSGGLDKWHDGQIATYDKRKGLLNGLSPASIFQDSNGRLWLSTTHEIGYLNNDRFISVSSTYDGRLLDIVEDASGDMWMADQRAGLLHIKGDKLVETFSWATLGHKDFAMSLAADPSNGGLWLGFFEGGISFFTGGRVRETLTAANGLGAGSVTHLQVEKDGVLWAATDNGLSRMNDRHFTTLDRRNGLPCDQIHWIVQDDDRSFWLDTRCGLLRLSRSEIDAWTAAANSGEGTRLIVHPTIFDSSDGVRVIEQAYRSYNPPATNHWMERFGSLLLMVLA